MIPAEWFRIAQAADIVTTAQTLGVGLKWDEAGKRTGKCFVCGGAEALVVDVKKKRWKCGHCGVDGRDAVTMVMHLRSLPLREALAYFVGVRP